ncbi:MULTISPECIES: CHC2 zinc finger domain-containing protein [unclassified Thioalkalivibrio]|uniref:CHC2 zinc finger domain-containing protein n=1 Tax=unclassified Thioalkalivibrio TaxID=2621013 RepID=UPI00037E14C9|nr:MULTISPECIES: CHC2 zinc finger domain-containing protein [unclassified Thioalkalivibrio]
MKIPQDFVDRLRSDVPIEDVIGRHVKLKKSGKEFQALCPFHTEKSPSFSVVPSKGFYHCFGCAEHGDSISFIMKFSQVDFRTAVEEVAAVGGLTIPEPTPDATSASIAKKSAESKKNADRKSGLISNALSVFQGTWKNLPEKTRRSITSGNDEFFSNEIGIGWADGAGSTSVIDLIAESPNDLELLRQAGLAEYSAADGRYRDAINNALILPAADSAGKLRGIYSIPAKGARVFRGARQVNWHGTGRPTWVGEPQRIQSQSSKSDGPQYQGGDRLWITDSITIYGQALNASIRNIVYVPKPEGFEADPMLQRLQRVSENQVILTHNESLLAPSKNPLLTAVARVSDPSVKYAVVPHFAIPQAAKAPPEALPGYIEQVVTGLQIYACPECSGGKERFLEQARPWVEEIRHPIYRSMAQESIEKEAAQIHEASLSVGSSSKAFISTPEAISEDMKDLIAEAVEKRGRISRPMPPHLQGQPGHNLLFRLTNEQAPDVTHAELAAAKLILDDVNAAKRAPSLASEDQAEPAPHKTRTP